MSSALEKFSWKDWIVAAIFFVVSLGVRIPFRSQIAYHWDGAQFALAIEKYDIRISQPQPPGYFLYVMLGRLVNCFIGEPHTSLVWMSVAAGALLGAVGFLLASAMFGRPVGIVSAVILTTSPLCWFYSEIALTSIVDALLVTTTVYVAWRSIRSGGAWRDVVWMSILFAAVAGVRQQSGAILAPVWLYGLVKSSVLRWRKIACGILLSMFLCCLWFVPMVRTTGGLAEYISLLQAKSHFDAPKTIWGGGGMNALLTNVSVMGRTCWVGLLLAAAISMGELVHWVFGERPDVKQQWYHAHAKQLCLLAIWIVPALLFWLSTYVTTPGYVLSFFTGIAIMAGIGVHRCATRLGRFFGEYELIPGRRAKIAAFLLVCGTIAGLNATVFVWQPRRLNRILASLPLTGVELREHDRQFTECFRVIRRSFKPEDVIIYHSNQFFYWGFRQFEYHLPEYRNVLLTPDSSLSGGLQRKLWIGEQRQTTFINSTDVLSERISLLVVPPGESIQLFQQYFDLSGAKLLGAFGMKLYVLPRRV
jgi:hypothetical protein